MSPERAAFSNHREHWGMLEGHVACQGRGATVGVAKVITRVSDMEETLVPASVENNILVIPYLRPDLIASIVDIIVGIVTDIGGAKSHAATIARELNIPCVVGARIATKIILDGGGIIIDGEKGRVFFRNDLGLGSVLASSYCFKKERQADDGQAQHQIRSILDELGIGNSRWRMRILNSVLGIVCLYKLDLTDVTIHRTGLDQKDLWIAASDELDLEKAEEALSKYSGDIPPVTVMQYREKNVLFMGSVRALESVLRSKPIDCIVVRLPDNLQKPRIVSEADMTLEHHLVRLRE